MQANFNPFKNKAAAMPFSGMPSNMGVSNVEKPTKSFMQTIDGLVGEWDKSMKEPEKLLERYMTVGDVDVHDLMIANTKSDITINIASQIATKIVQAYERVQQIQV